MAEETNFSDDLLENYAKSSEIMLSGSPEVRKEEAKTFDICATQVAKRSDSEQKAYESERDFNHKVEMDKLEYELKKAESEAKVKAEEARVETERKESEARMTDMVEKRKDEKKSKTIGLIVKSVVAVVSVAVPTLIQVGLSKIELEEGRMPTSEKKANLVDKLVDKVAKNLK